MRSEQNGECADEPGRTRKKRLGLWELTDGEDSSN